MSIFTSDSGNNRFGWKNLAFEKLVSEARSMEKTKARATLFQRADEILVEKDVVVIPLYYSTLASLVSPRINSLVLSPLNYLFLRNVSSR